MRILNAGTEAVTRVLIESADESGEHWTTIGVSPNIIDASFQALMDFIVYKLMKSGAPALMIDHISIEVRDLAKAEAFYAAVLATIGFAKMREWPDAAIGFGKKHPEFWINKRASMSRVADDSGVHICLRAPDTASVDAFHAAALKAGGFFGRRARPAERNIIRAIMLRSCATPMVIASRR